MKVRFLILHIVVLACSNSVRLAAEEVDFEIAADYFGKYIWRGQNLSEDSVFQPGLSIGYGNLTAWIWGNMDLANINGNSGDFSEMDYSLDYSKPMTDMEGIGYSIGFIYYDFPGTMTKDTTEVYWGLNFDLPFKPSITVYHDIDEAEGSYATLSFGLGIEKITQLTPYIPVGLDISSSLGWGSGSYNKYYWGTEQSKLNDLVFSVSFPVEIHGWSLVPSLNYVTLLSDDIRDTDAYGTDSDFFFAGISLSKSF